MTRKPLDHAPHEPKARFPQAPWMRYAGASLPAAIVTWFKTPKRDRPRLGVPILTTMLLMAAVVLGVWGIVWLISLLVPD